MKKDEYKALGVQHHVEEESEQLEATPVRATLAIVCMFLACFIGAVIALGVLKP